MPQLLNLVAEEILKCLRSNIFMPQKIIKKKHSNNMGFFIVIFYLFFFIWFDRNFVLFLLLVDFNWILIILVILLLIFFSTWLKLASFCFCFKEWKSWKMRNTFCCYFFFYKKSKKYKTKKKKGEKKDLFWKCFLNDQTCQIWFLVEKDKISMKFSKRWQKTVEKNA